MSTRLDGANQLSQQLLGKPFDDTEPRDMARLVAMFLERAAKWLRGTRVPDAFERELVVEQMRQVGACMRAWAEFGRWDEKRSPYAPLTPRLRELIECACIELDHTRSDDLEHGLRRVALIDELRKAIAPPNPAGAEP